MDIDERAVKIVEEAEALSKTDLRGALAKMREALALEPDYPNLEDEIFIREDAIAKLDGVLEFIVVLLREGKDYQACEMLEGLPENYIIQDKSGLVAGLVEKIERAKTLIEQAREQANRDPVKAIPIFEEAVNLVSDYPGLVEEISALKQGASQYDSSVAAIEEAMRNKEVGRAADLFDSFRQSYPDDDKVGRFKVDLVNLSKELVKKKDRKVNFLKIGITVGLVLAVIGGYLAFEMFMMQQADRKGRELDRLLAAEKFAESQALGREIKQDLGKIRAFFLNDKQQLLAKIDEILQSESLMMGAEGKVFFEGRYIPAAQLDGRKVFHENLEQGEALAAAGKCDEAMARVEAAVAVATDKKIQAAPTLIDGVKGAIDNCRLKNIKELVNKAEALRASGAYAAAHAAIAEALARAAEYPAAVGGAGEDPVAEALALKERINRARLIEMVALGDKLAGQGSFDKADAEYRAAAAFAGSHELTDYQLSRRIPELLDKNRVESVLADGDRAFAADKWQESVRIYEEGIALARQVALADLPSLDRARENLAQARKMVTVAVLQHLNKQAAESVKAGKNNKARRIYEQAIEQAEKNKWRDSKEVAALLGELQEGLAVVEENIFVEDKRAALLGQFAAILSRDFGLEKDATLLDPQVVLMDSTPERLEFSLSAMAYDQESAGGQYTRYQVTYLFDRKTKSWRLLDKISGE
ncbi:MAG: hypothetical protein P1P81_00270 [Desulfobulbales bacterium]|nr:hypothetical protein [Desulfobulbales bacterium]